MKKLNLLCTVLLLVIALCSSLLVVSCTEDSVAIEEDNLSEFKQQLVLAKGFDKEDLEVADIISEADATQLLKFIENARIAHYLREQNLLNKVYYSMEEGDHFSDLELGEFLSQDQLSNLKTYTYRGDLKRNYSCKYFFHDADCNWYRCCYFEFPVCWFVCK